MTDIFKPLCAVYLFLVKYDEILLLRRANTGYQDGNYGVPSGWINGNENVRSAMVREAHEEIGITLKPEDLKLAHVMHRIENDGIERVDFFFLANHWTGQIKINEPHKCDDLNWFNISTLPSNTISYIRSAIKQMIDKNVFSEYGWHERYE